MGYHCHHREVFTSLSGVDYTPDIRDRIVLSPPEELRSVWERDYSDMQQSMIYGASLPFDALLERISLLEKKFHDRWKASTLLCADKGGCLLSILSSA